MLRFLALILACSTTVFGAFLEETTLAPTSYVEDGNDQEPPPVFLNEEFETETFEDSKIVGEDEGIVFPPKDDQELDEEQEKEGESNVDDESNQTEGEIVEGEGEEGEGDDVEIEPGSNFVNDTKNTTLVEPIEDTNSDVDDALEPSDPNQNQEEGNGDGDDDGDGDGDMLPGQLLGGNSEGGAGGEGGDNQFAFSRTVDPGLNDITEAPISDEFSDFAPTATQVETPYTASPTTYRPPTLRPSVPYVSTGTLKDTNDNGWTWNDSTMEEMEHDKTVIIALSVVFGLMFFFSIFVAYQLLENPDGFCSSICRITVACWCGITRCICYPCRSMCGCTGQSGGQHMIVPDDGHFTHDLELS